MRFTREGFSLRLSPIRNASTRAGTTTFDRRLVRAESGLLFCPSPLSLASPARRVARQLGREGGNAFGRRAGPEVREKRGGERNAPYLAVKVPLHRVKTRVNYERRVRPSLVVLFSPLLTRPYLGAG